MVFSRVMRIFLVVFKGYLNIFFCVVGFAGVLVEFMFLGIFFFRYLFLRF